jgi:hypothetical protein
MKDTKPRKIYMGLPARCFGEVPDEELLGNQKFPGKKA